LGPESNERRTLNMERVFNLVAASVAAAIAVNRLLKAIEGL
jgi:hypothetical protein